MSLSEPYDQDNIFQKILRGEIPAAKVAETSQTLTFMDAFPQSEGHTLVIPKTDGATNILNLEAETLRHLIVEVQRIAKAVEAALSPDGIRIVQFNGAPAGQSVFHIHFHIIPVWEGKTLGAHGDGMADADELNRLADQIKAQL